jgi:hypothetical protein
MGAKNRSDVTNIVTTIGIKEYNNEVCFSSVLEVEKKR